MEFYQNFHPTHLPYVSLPPPHPRKNSGSALACGEVMSVRVLIFTALHHN